jgi:hypothetical protein
MCSDLQAEGWGILYGFVPLNGDVKVTSLLQPTFFYMSQYTFPFYFVFHLQWAALCSGSPICLSRAPLLPDVFYAALHVGEIPIVFRSLNVIFWRLLHFNLFLFLPPNISVFRNYTWVIRSERQFFGVLLFLGPFTSWRKAHVSFVMSFCLSFRLSACISASPSRRTSVEVDGRDLDENLSNKCR